MLQLAWCKKYFPEHASSPLRVSPPSPGMGGNLPYVLALFLALTKDYLQGESWKFTQDEENTRFVLAFWEGRLYDTPTLATSGGNLKRFYKITLHSLYFQGFPILHIFTRNLQ